MTTDPRSDHCPLCRIPGAVVHYAMRPDGIGGRKSVAIGFDCPNARCHNFSPIALRNPRTD